MELLLSIGLPLSLAFIMVTLGLGLTMADFARVFQRPKAFLAGALAQVVILPVAAFLIVQMANLPAALAFGVMLLAFCPGGVTTNMLARLAGGDVALSVSLTAVISLLSIVTVPLLVAFASSYFLGKAAEEIDVTGIAFKMFLITAVPVGIGMALRELAPAFADGIEKTVTALATVLFIVVVLAAILANWQLLMDNIAGLGMTMILMNVVLLGIGWTMARSLGFGREIARTIAIESGVQNATLGITVAAILTGSATLDGYALPSAIYGVTMYFVTLPAILVMRRTR